MFRPSVSHWLLLLLIQSACVGAPNNTPLVPPEDAFPLDVASPPSTDGTSTPFDAQPPPPGITDAWVMDMSSDEDIGTQAPQDALMGPPEDGSDGEACDGLDNDGDGRIHEAFDIGSDCLKSVGDCIGQGVWACAQNAPSRRVCVVPDSCNGIDETVIHPSMKASPA